MTVPPLLPQVHDFARDASFSQTKARIRSHPQQQHPQINRSHTWTFRYVSISSASDYMKPARDAMKQVCIVRMISFVPAGNASKIKPISIGIFAGSYTHAVK